MPPRLDALPRKRRAAQLGISVEALKGRERRARLKAQKSDTGWIGQRITPREAEPTPLPPGPETRR